MYYNVYTQCIFMSPNVYQESDIHSVYTLSIYIVQHHIYIEYIHCTTSHIHWVTCYNVLQCIYTTYIHVTKCISRVWYTFGIHIEYIHCTTSHIHCVTSPMMCTMYYNVYTQCIYRLPEQWNVYTQCISMLSNVYNVSKCIYVELLQCTCIYIG